MVSGLNLNTVIGMEMDIGLGLIWTLVSGNGYRSGFGSGHWYWYGNGYRSGFDLDTGIEVETDIGLGLIWTLVLKWKRI